MNAEQQQDLFSLFSPTSGVHKEPPPAAAGAIVFERSRRARHYRLTLRRDGTAVATIPTRGSVREAERFVAQHQDWLERARARHRRRPRAAEVWTPGTNVLWRGEMTEIRIAAPALGAGEAPSADSAGSSPAGLPLRPGLGVRAGQANGGRPAVCLAADVFRVAAFDHDLRPALEAHFSRRARIELPARTWELAAVAGVEVKHVTVRNQRSRWGSCSASGTISLNWRLVQTPDFVRDYIIHHELMHLREMNHSARFWARVEEVCPGWRDAEHWLKRNGSLLGL